MDESLQNLQPLVSIIIPGYNRAEYIAETIESVLAQTYRNIEIIVVDDGSTDNTREIVAEYLPKVQYIWQENSERGASRNHGLRLAKGEFISFLDSDDLWLPNKIESDLEFFNKNLSFGVIHTDAIQIDANGNKLKLLKRKGFQGRITAKLLEDNFILMATHLARTQVIREIGGFREERQLSGSEDWEMWVRLSTVTDFAYLPKATTKIRTHEANTMSDAGGMNNSMDYALEIFRNSKYLTAKQKKILSKTKAYVSLINAINYCSVKESRKAATFLKRAFRNNFKIIFDPRFSYTILRLVKGYVIY
ncbi:MAG: glycosyltransferase [Pyrinomonadaceae bacterium]